MQQNYSKKIDPIQKASKNTASSVLDASSQSEALQRKADMANNAAQREEAPRPNNTGMPDNLKTGIESLSGFSMDDVRVHYNSSKPATVQALAYTQGTDIHVAPGQEKHLPHEAWHVAQQMAGRVSPTTNINGMPVNDNAALEHEADVMGEKAVQCKAIDFSKGVKKSNSANVFIQRKFFEKTIEGEYIWHPEDYVDKNKYKFTGKKRRHFLRKYNVYEEDVIYKLIQQIYQKYGNDVLRSTINSYYKNDSIQYEKHPLIAFHLLKTGTENTTITCLLINALDEPTFCTFIRDILPPDLSDMNRKNFKSQEIQKLHEDKSLKRYATKKFGSENTTDAQTDIKSKLAPYDEKKQSSPPKGTDKDPKNIFKKKFHNYVNVLNNCLKPSDQDEKIDALKTAVNKHLKSSMVLYEAGKMKGCKAIRNFVLAQIKMLKEKKEEMRFERIFSIVLLGFARKLSYILGDPWAEDQIAKQLAAKVQAKSSKETETTTKSSDDNFWKQVHVFARSNPVLMYLNKELTLHDMETEIKLRSNSAEVSEDDMYKDLIADAKRILESMKDCKAFLQKHPETKYDPASIGMFGLYADEKKMSHDLGNLENQRNAKSDDTPEKEQHCSKSDDTQEKEQHSTKSDDTQEKEKIKNKLNNAPITIRLHSTDLGYQKNFYHARPWFNFAPIDDDSGVVYHPLIGRSGISHYSLWRTYKDHRYRFDSNKPLKGKDGEKTPDGADYQSIEQGAIQQSFGALNFNYETTCKGLLNDVDYGNVVLCLNSNVKTQAYYTFGCEGILHKSIEEVVNVLEKNEEKKINGEDNNSIQTVMDALKKDNEPCEELEAQIFKDVKFPDDIKEIACVGVTDQEYEQLVKMAGGSIKRDEDTEEIIEQPELVKRY